MSKKAILALEDGSIYEGVTFGAEATTFGEVVFCTSMTGYQEMLTDPSFAGQIVIPTYPLIGNYGINATDSESLKIQVRGFVVREYCPVPSHWQSKRTLDGFLKESNIPGISGIDTRALTRRLRSAGVMMGMLTSELTSEEALKQLSKLPSYGNIDFVKEVSTKINEKGEDILAKEAILVIFQGGKGITVYNKDSQYRYHIVILDCGTKYNIMRILHRMSCSVTAVPCTATAAEILEMNPDGIVLSPGPGDPALLGYLEKTVRGLIGKKPMMGICLGHQLIPRALGSSTFKLKFGHRGANHPVKDLTTGRVYITAQNHGYAVDADTLKGGLEVSHVNLNDGTVEGLRHRELPLFTIQYHSEASPGPRDNEYLFQQFLGTLDETSR